VIYMGVSTAGRLASRLIEAGRAGSTPALIVEDASLPTERRIVTTLAGLSEAAVAVTGPALLIVGEAMALAQANPSPSRGGARGGGLVGTDDALDDPPAIAETAPHPQPLTSRGRGARGRKP